MIDKSVADKMTSMMLGTFTNGTGISSSPADYVMAGKTGTTEAVFNPEYTSDQWVIGYTPDVVISHWLGFPTTDENHYLAGSTSNGAAHVFRNIANTILPYTPGSTFTVENAYKQNGLHQPIQEIKCRVMKRIRRMIPFLILEVVRKIW